MHLQWAKRYTPFHMFSHKTETLYVLTWVMCKPFLFKMIFNSYKDGKHKTT